MTRDRKCARAEASYVRAGGKFYLAGGFVTLADKLSDQWAFDPVTGVDLANDTITFAKGAGKREKQSESGAKRMHQVFWRRAAPARVRRRGGSSRCVLWPYGKMLAAEAARVKRSSRERRELGL